MRRLILFVLLAPAPLHAQERAYDPAPLMAAAIEETLKPASNAAEIRETLRANGIIPAPRAAPRKYKLSRAVYSFERPERRDAPFTLPRATRAATENAALASAIATRLGVATTANAETEAKTCSQVPYPEGSSRTGTYPLCRYAQTDAVVAASVPVVSGDTALVDVMKWSNHSRATRGITFQVMEVTLVRTNNVWTAVSRRSIGTVDG